MGLQRVRHDWATELNWYIFTTYLLFVAIDKQFLVEKPQNKTKLESLKNSETDSKNLFEIKFDIVDGANEIGKEI